MTRTFIVKFFTNKAAYSNKKRKILSVVRSSHVFKKSKEHFFINKSRYFLVNKSQFFVFSLFFKECSVQCSSVFKNKSSFKVNIRVCEF